MTPKFNSKIAQPFYKKLKITPVAFLRVLREERVSPNIPTRRNKAFYEKTETNYRIIWK